MSVSVYSPIVFKGKMSEKIEPKVLLFIWAEADESGKKVRVDLGTFKNVKEAQKFLVSAGIEGESGIVRKFIYPKVVEAKKDEHDLIAMLADEKEKN